MGGSRKKNTLPISGTGEQADSKLSVRSIDPRFYFPRYQPIVDIATGSIVGYESLSRTFDSFGKVVSAGSIFSDESVPENARLRIDRAVRLKALYRFANDPSAGLVYLNVSPRWAIKIASGEESPTIKMIRETGIDPARVVIEITEKLADVRVLEALTNVYRREGLKIAIDDFGVGGSQIDRLLALEPDYLKVDMDIFKDAARGGASANLLLTLSALSKQTRFEIICEGVETEQELHFAMECGAQKVQGWLFGKAESAFLKADLTKYAVSYLQMMYLKRKKERLQLHLERNRQIAACVKHIQYAYLNNKLDELDVPQLQSIGLMRYFICDLNGNQISPNVNFTHDGFSFDKTVIGSCWCHRPYFPLVHGLDELPEREHLISDSYIDVRTHELCRTSSMKIGNGQILLVDSKVYDDVLFVEDDGSSD
jgi:EAL domain-containing protein (putative c-di-GMP-specific phosphodiesterase class I)